MSLINQSTVFWNILPRTAVVNEYKDQEKKSEGSNSDRFIRLMFKLRLIFCQ